MKKNYYFSFVLLMLLFSCSKNYYPTQLFEESKDKKSKVTQLSIEYDGKSYVLPLNAEITLTNGKTVKTIIKKQTEKDVFYGNSSAFYSLKNVSKIVPLDKPIQSGSQSEVAIKVYFGTNEIEQPYEIVSFYRWDFISLFGKEEKLAKCVFYHMENCKKLNGDAVIIQPNLINSIVIKYKN